MNNEKTAWIIHDNTNGRCVCKNKNGEYYLSKDLHCEEVLKFETNTEAFHELLEFVETIDKNTADIECAFGVREQN